MLRDAWAEVAIVVGPAGQRVGDSLCRVGVGVERDRERYIRWHARIELHRWIEGVSHGQRRARQHARVNVQRIGGPDVVGAAPCIDVALNIADRAGHRNHVMSKLVEGDTEPIRCHLQ